MLLLGLAGCFDNYDRSEVADASIEIVDDTVSRISVDFTGIFPQRVTVGPLEGFTISALPETDYPVTLTGSGSFVNNTILGQVHAELDHYYSSLGVELTGTLDFTMQVDDAFSTSSEGAHWVGTSHLTADVTARWRAEGHHDLDVTRCWNNEARGFSGTVDGEYTRNIYSPMDPDCVTPR